MQTALHLKATVLPGGKIEVTDPQLPCGESVDVFVLLPESSPIWSPHESFEAANVLLDALKADRQNP